MCVRTDFKAGVSVAIIACCCSLELTSVGILMHLTQALEILNQGYLAILVVLLHLELLIFVVLLELRHSPSRCFNLTYLLLK